jgi:hypothetical protein
MILVATSKYPSTYPAATADSNCLSLLCFSLFVSLPSHPPPKSHLPEHLPEHTTVRGPRALSLWWRYHPPAHAWYDAGALGEASYSRTDALIAMLKLSHNHQRSRGQHGSGVDARRRSRGLVRGRAGVLASLASGLLIGLAVRWVGAVRGSAGVAEAYRQSDTANEQTNTQTTSMLS